MLDFLLSQGAYLVHVSPQFLLSYDDYLISIDIVQSNVSHITSYELLFKITIKVICRRKLKHHDNSICLELLILQARRKKLFGTNCVPRERLSRQLFESRNKQCWLDVILQTYKCFVLRGIHEHKYWASPRFLRRSTVYRESIISSTSRFVIA